MKLYEHINAASTREDGTAVVVAPSAHVREDFIDACLKDGWEFGKWYMTLSKEGAYKSTSCA